MRFFTITSLLAALTIASPIVEYMEPRGDVPDKKDIRIKTVSISGTGCPPGTVWSDVGEDATLLAITYSKFEAATGPGKTITDARKFCNVRIGLDYPAGWSYTVATTVVRGYVKAPKKCSAKLSALYFFSGYKDDAQCSVKFNGPVDKRFVEDTAVSALVWSKCGVKGKEGPLFNVNTDVSVDCKDSDGATIGVDTQDTKFELKLLLQWKRC